MQWGDASGLQLHFIALSFPAASVPISRVLRWLRCLVSVCSRTTPHITRVVPLRGSRLSEVPRVAHSAPFAPTGHLTAVPPSPELVTSRAGPAGGRPRPTRSATHDLARTKRSYSGSQLRSRADNWQVVQPRSDFTHRKCDLSLPFCVPILASHCSQEQCAW